MKPFRPWECSSPVWIRRKILVGSVAISSRGGCVGRGKVMLFTLHFFSLFFLHAVKKFSWSSHWALFFGKLFNSSTGAAYSLLKAKAGLLIQRTYFHVQYFSHLDSSLFMIYDLMLQRRAYFTTSRSNSAFWGWWCTVEGSGKKR